jgi:hypothetical protein
MERSKGVLGFSLSTFRALWSWCRSIGFQVDLLAGYHRGQTKQLAKNIRFDHDLKLKEGKSCMLTVFGSGKASLLNTFIPDVYSAPLREVSTLFELSALPTTRKHLSLLLALFVRTRINRHTGQCYHET